MLFSMVMFIKKNTPQFNILIRSQYGNGYDFKHEIIEYRCNISFIPTKGFCFVKWVSFLTGEDYKQQNLDFNRNEKRRSCIMMKAKIQPFCRANIINLGFYDGERDRLQKEIKLYIYSIFIFV